MSRSVGVVEALRELLPAPVAAAFALVTQLGDVWLYAVVLTFLYWYGNREDTVRIVGVGIGAIGVTLALKQGFALPRPDVGPPPAPAFLPAVLDPVYAEMTHADGYGFPSGHAVGSTAIWGAIALWTDVGTRRQRFLVAATLVGLISLSRLALGVHFLVDVVAGVAVGATYLWVTAVATSRAGDGGVIALEIGTALTGTVALINGTEDSLAAFGAAAGALVAWYAVDVPLEPWPRTHVGAGYAVATIVALGAVGLVWTVFPLSGLTIFVVAAFTVGGVIAAPAAVRRAKKRKTRTRTP
ncbi:phosphatase PAP2 family protein [Halostella sp. JP-L12]|uniref:phosphatase PAP2 family protein n=1 Tax=Halostella TaxID=1843185 RepID=UPI000EF783E3|nr:MULTISPECIES: phosphatase PAP2 family protein [Halostella]NHN46770.1 phosphatase PAP2 family protein [Halostella sp. JP-L12]